jgi:dihydrofolate reductase
MKTPRFRIYIAASLDGFIATADGGVEWLEPFNAQEYGYDAFLESVDALVMGRATYDQSLGFGPWPYEGKTTWVVSTHPVTSPRPGVNAWPWGVPKLVETLREIATGDVWLVGGGRLLSGFIEANGADELDLFVMPRVLGDGTPLFERGTHAASLRLLSSHAYPNSVVRLRYAIEPAP